MCVGIHGKGDFDLRLCCDDIPCPLTSSMLTYTTLVHYLLNPGGTHHSIKNAIRATLPFLLPSVILSTSPTVMLVTVIELTSMLMFSENAWKVLCLGQKSSTNIFMYSKGAPANPVLNGLGTPILTPAARSPGYGFLVAFVVQCFFSW